MASFCKNFFKKITSTVIYKYCIHQYKLQISNKEKCRDKNILIKCLG